MGKNKKTRLKTIETSSFLLNLHLNLRLEALFDKLDLSGDHEIEFSEFIAAANASRYMCNEALIKQAQQGLLGLEEGRLHPFSINFQQFSINFYSFSSGFSIVLGCFLMVSMCFMVFGRFETFFRGLRSAGRGPKRGDLDLEPAARLRGQLQRPDGGGDPGAGGLQAQIHTPRVYLCLF